MRVRIRKKSFKPTLGAIVSGDGCHFSVWAPFRESVSLHLISPEERLIPMRRDKSGYFNLYVGELGPGARYAFRLDDEVDRPDPASRFQPDGVHAPSMVVSRGFSWSDGGWRGLPLDAYVLYETHVGTFTAEGTFDAMIPHLKALRDLGITAIELMPVAQVPGGRNWGYDGVQPFAAQNSYGGPDGFRRLVDACHNAGIAVVLDVVYNHLGPEGNYLAEFAPYFTDRYKTPWGAAMNFDGAYSDEVRRFFIENALYWIVECHVDALRLDALHAIVDISATPFIEELGESVRAATADLGRPIHLIAETSLNNARLVTPRGRGGYGLDAQWNDDFHHALHTLLTGEQSGYYQDFGSLDDLCEAFKSGYVYTGQYSAFRKRSHGNGSKHLKGEQLVVFSQNHDQVGNRMLGERLASLVSFEQLKLAAGTVLLSPFLPLLFMGEEYGEIAPFQYFVSHSDPDLVDAVRKGRREEFPGIFSGGEMPDPQDEVTFRRARLNHGLKEEGKHKLLLSFFRKLLFLRKTVPALAVLDKKRIRVVQFKEQNVLLARRPHETGDAALILHFGEESTSISFPFADGIWEKLIDSAENVWGGDGSAAPLLLPTDAEATLQVAPWSLVLYVQKAAVGESDP